MPIHPNLFFRLFPIYGLAMCLFFFVGSGKAQTLPASRTIPWNLAGMTHPISYPTRVLNILNFGARNDSSGTTQTAFNACITALNGQPGIIYFPPGKYRFTRGIVVPSGIVIRGDRADRTALLFDMGTGVVDNCISITGTGGTYRKITAFAGRGSKTLTINNSSDFSAGTNGQIIEANPWDTQPATSWAANSPGQMVTVASVNGNQVTITEPLLTAINVPDSAKMRKVSLVIDVGIENLRITRLADATSGYNIYFGLAQNCWVKGIESRYSAAAHILLDQSAHCEISGNFIQNAYTYDGSATRGYGICLITQNSFCKIENNVLRNLRHHIIMKQGACGNVAAYNYCRDPYRSEIPHDAGTDLAFHGFRASANLYEGNIAGFAQATETWGPTGANNALFRNRLSLYGVYISPVTSGTNRNQTDSMIYVANDITDTASVRNGYPTGIFLLSGSGHFTYANRVKNVLNPAAVGTVSVPEKSWYLNYAPTWWNNADPFGGIGFGNAYNTNMNPAKRRYDANGLLFVPADTTRGNIQVCTAPTITASAPFLCAGGNLTLTSSLLYGNIWSTGETSQSIAVSNPGNYSVKTISGTCTSALSAIYSVNIANLPNTISASGALQIYSGDSLQLSAASGFQYQWNTGQITNSIWVKAAGTYTVTISNGSCSTMGTAMVTVSNSVPPSLIVSNSQSLQGTFTDITVRNTATLTLSANLSVRGILQLDSGATLNTGVYTISGPGGFTMASKATLITSNPDGITITGNYGAIRTLSRNFGTAGNFVFNGTNAQITGLGFPVQVNSLEAANPISLQLSNPTDILTSLKLTAGVFDCNHLKLRLLSGPNGTANLNTVQAGASISNAENFIAQRWYSGSGTRYNGAYYFVGTPVNGTTVAAWQQNGNVFVPNTFNPALRNQSSVWLLNNAGNTFPTNNGWVKPTGLLQTITPGQGLQVWFNANFYAGNHTTELQGSPATGNINLPLNYCSGICAGNTTSNGWNLVANPFPSVIDWDSPNWTKTGIGQAIYIWNYEKNGYATYSSGIGLNGGSRLLASGQGFMVQALASSPILMATEQVKLNSNSVSALRTGNNSVAFIRLKINQAGKSDEMALADQTNNSLFNEPEFDATKLMNTHLNIWAEPLSGINQAISSFNFQTADSIPILISSTKTDSASLIIDELSNLDAVYFLTLKENKTGRIYPLASGQKIGLFLDSSNTHNLCLYLHPRTVLGLAGMGKGSTVLFPNPMKGTFTLSGKAYIKEVKIYNALGQRVFKQTFEGNKNTEDVTAQIPSGIYRVEVLGDTVNETIMMVVE